MNNVMSDALKISIPFASSITPSILKHDRQAFVRLLQELHSFAPSCHIDVCDGAFVSAMTVPYVQPSEFDPAFFVGLSFKAIATEVHLMVQDPHNIGCDFIRAGAARIIVHWESFQSTTELTEVVDSWRSRGATTALSILLSTDIAPLVAYLAANESAIVGVQVMSIDPIGMQGKQFDTRALKRIEQLRVMFPHLEISIDGGMNAQTIPAVLTSGGSRVVVGSITSDPLTARARYEQLCTAVYDYARVR
jgi:ribulose-phosphate 3-epimerase